MNNWQIKKLGEVCSIQTGKYDANHAKTKGKYRFYTCAFEHFYCDTNRFKGESIILPGNGANVGEVFYYNGEFDAYQRTYVLNEIKTNAKYLFYHLLGNWKTRNKDKQFGSATNYIRMANFTDYEIPVPPLETQHAIVSKIEELFSELDQGIADLKTAQAQLKVYRQSVLKHAFEGKLTNKNVKEGELPEGWEVSELKNVCEVKRGKSKHRPRNAPELYGGKYPFVQTGDIRNANGGYIKKYSQSYSELGLQQSKLWPKGTLCITIAANIGETAILDFDACFPDSVVGLLTNEKVLFNKYLNYFFISFKQKLEELAPATAQKNINVNILENIKLPITTIEEQHLIVQEIESRLSVADKMEESIQESLQKAEALRQSILKKAFSGELV